MNGNFEYEFMRKDGSRVYTSIAVAQIRDDEGSCLGTLALVSDITMRKKMENELRQEKEKLETITESIGVGLTITSKDYHILWTNKVMKQIRGIQDLEGRKCYATYNYLDTICPDCGVKKVFEGKESDSREYMVFDREKGSAVWTQLIATPIKDKDGNVTAALELVLPITERKRQERKIENLSKFPSENPNPVLRIDGNGTILYCNQAGAALLTVWNSKVGERAPEHISQVVAYALASNKRNEVEETLEAKTFSLLFAPVTVEGYVNIYANDITERKRTESFLRNSEEKFRNLAEQSPNIIFINQKGKVVYANTEAEEAMGYTKEEFYSPEFNFMDLVAPKSKELVKSQFIKHMKGEEIRPYEYKLILKKGKTIDVINSTKLLDYNGEPAILGIETDITENKRLKEKLEKYSIHLESLVKERTAQLEQAQAQLVKSERLAAIGELAGMVGHDLRNPLTGIKNAAYYLKKKSGTISEAQTEEMLEIIDKAIDHSNKIINDLLDYSREMHLELTEIETSALLNEAMQMIQVPDRIKIVNHVLGETWFRVDADKMMRVFINLIKNAIDAMPEKGTLEIRSRLTGGKVEIAFADTGMGIPEEVLPKLFTPLFTTKAQGMGFGLAICKRIIESHGGTITVKTAVNNGTTFTITLPIKPKVEFEDEKTWINMPESLLSTTRA
jgi:PAS domain S-box-containing protein